MQSLKDTVQVIHCPNCGAFAEREYIANRQIIQTQCQTCDYLMVTCSQSKRVVEAYAPGVVMCSL